MNVSLKCSVHMLLFYLCTSSPSSSLSLPLHPLPTPPPPPSSSHPLLIPSLSHPLLPPPLSPSSSPSPPTCTQHTHGHADGSDEETEFMQKLDYLRTQAEVFLRMFNDMRRRLKELPPDALATKQYWCVLVYLCMMSSTINTGIQWNPA